MSRKTMEVPEANSSGDLSQALSLVARGREAQGLPHDIDGSERGLILTDDLAELEVYDDDAGEQDEPEQTDALELFEEPEGEVDEEPDERPTTEEQPAPKKKADDRNARRNRKLARMNEQILELEGTVQRAFAEAVTQRTAAEHWKERATRAESLLAQEGLLPEGDHSPSVQNRILELDTSKASHDFAAKVNDYLAGRKRQLELEDKVDEMMDEHREVAERYKVDHHYTLSKWLAGDRRPPEQIIREDLLKRRGKTAGGQHPANQPPTRPPKPIKTNAGRRTGNRTSKRDDVDVAADLVHRWRGA